MTADDTQVCTLDLTDREKHVLAMIALKRAEGGWYAPPYWSREVDAAERLVRDGLIGRRPKAAWGREQPLHYSTLDHPAFVMRGGK